MSKLQKDIEIYQAIVGEVSSCSNKEIGEICSDLSITEKSLLNYLEAAAQYIDFSNILWQGKPLTLEGVQEYNKKNKVKASKEVNKSARLAKLINLLNNTTPHGGMTLEDLVNKLDVSDRTVYRDLDDLEQKLGIIIVRPDKEVGGTKGKYKLENTYLPSISPDKALFIFLSILQQKDTALTVGIQEIKQALIGTLTKNKYNIKDIPLEKLEKRIYIVDQTLTEPEKVSENFLKIIRAIEQSNSIEITYFKSYSQEISKRRIEPYGLVCKHHNWYLIANCLEKEDLRTFRIDQIERVSIETQTKFTFPSNFNLQNHFENCWGVFQDETAVDVKVKFSNSVAYRLKKIKYHPSQEIIEELEDGSIIVSYKITGMKEFIGWLLQWRTSAIVLEPQSLVDLFKKSLNDTLALYE